MDDAFLRELKELEGYLELGMQRECLAVARKLLKRRRISPAIFNSCVDAILIQADRLKPWRPIIDTAFVGLKPEFQQEARQRLFHFYVALKDSKAARAFLPSNPTEPTDLLFSIWTLLTLRETEKAKPIYRKCRRVLRNLSARRIADSEFEFVAGILIEAVASYLAQMQRWEEAQEFWRFGSTFGPFTTNAWDGLVKLHALRALLETGKVSEILRDEEFWQEDSPVMLPGNRQTTRVDVEKRFRRYEKHLTKVVPVKERWQFGLSVESNPGDEK